MIMAAWEVHIEGRVQGVGFRPFVKRLADTYHIPGEVLNTPEGVVIRFSSDELTRDEFIAELLSRPPSAARIIHHEQFSLEKEYEGPFKIISSESEGPSRLMIPPDIAMCSSCRAEVNRKDDRREGYAFTTCTQCGPRFSVMTDIPYDRDRTTMSRFKMCPSCQSEYEETKDRRFHSQTQSCQDCGVSLFFLKGGMPDRDPIDHSIEILKRGEILALKGIGGFLLLVDASNEESVIKLRERKHRPSKPFACLFPSEDMVRELTLADTREIEQMKSPEAPIVLVTIKEEGRRVLGFDQLAPGLDRIGIMLPYAPLLELIAHGFGAPLIATSANVSGSPIIYRDEDALDHLSSLADAILTNDREIVVPQDDSVTIISRQGQFIPIRRSRGYAPSILNQSIKLADGLLAMGAEMKSAFAFSHLGNLYQSQFLGDGSLYESQSSYEHSLQHLRGLLRFNPSKILIDSHPDYFSSQFGRRIANEEGVDFQQIQHHEAHFASVLWENDLLFSEKPILGVIWDGTGWGPDGRVWGGEFFLAKEDSIQRIAHLTPFQLLSNERMMKEPPVATLSAFFPGEPNKEWQKDCFSDPEYSILHQLLERGGMETTSMGRLFDAVAGLILRIQYNTYEGEAALKLQGLAEGAVDVSWYPYELSLSGEDLQVSNLMMQIQDDLAIHTESRVALRFHQTLVEWIARVASRQGILDVAFSGGVFQNTLLVDMIHLRLGHDHQLHFHRQLPPNDESIPMGQIAWMTMMEGLKTEEERKNNSDVFSSTR